MPFDYTDVALQALDKYISPERLAAYSGLARGDHWVALKLYEKNAQLSGALYPVIQGLEVTIRNSIHNLMIERLGCAEWYDRFPFNTSERAEIDEAKDTLRENGQPTTPGRVISELTFGFWVKLTSRIYENTLWTPHISRMFPIRVSRPVVHDRLVQLKTLRNRIAHHERIIGRARLLPVEYADTIEAIRWVSPTVSEWVESHNTFKEEYAKKFPNKRPRPALAAAIPIPEER